MSHPGARLPGAASSGFAQPPSARAGGQPRAGGAAQQRRRRPTTVADLEASLKSATATPQAVCEDVERFLASASDKYSYGAFFERCFPQLLTRLYSFDTPARAWVATARGQAGVAVAALLRPQGPLMRAARFVDADDARPLAFYFPTERLPKRTQAALRSDQQAAELGRSAWHLRGRLERRAAGQWAVRLNTVDYLLFWTAYYAVRSGASPSRSVGTGSSSAAGAGAAGAAQKLEAAAAAAAGALSGRVTAATQALQSHLKPLVSSGQASAAPQPPKPDPWAERHPYKAIVRALLRHMIPPLDGGRSDGSGEFFGAGNARGVGGSQASRSPGALPALPVATAAETNLLLAIIMEFWLEDLSPEALRSLDGLGGCAGAMPPAAALPRSPPTFGGGEQAASRPMYPVLPSVNSAYAPIPTVTFPSAEVIDVLQELVEHLHTTGHSAGAGGGSLGYHTQAGRMGGTGPLEVLSVQMQQLQRPLYCTLCHIFASWPADGVRVGVRSMTVVAWLWRAYLLPWQYYRGKLVDGEPAPSAGLRLGGSSASSGGHFDVRWTRWVLANLPFYVTLLQHVVVCCCRRATSDREAERESAINNLGRALRIFKDEPKLLALVERGWRAYVAYVGAGAAAAGSGAVSAAVDACGAMGAEAKAIGEALPVVHSQLAKWDGKLLREALGGEAAAAATLPPATPLGGIGGLGGRATPATPLPAAAAAPAHLSRLDIFGEHGLPQVMRQLAQRLTADARRGRTVRKDAVKQLAAAAEVVCHDASLKSLLEAAIAGAKTSKSRTTRDTEREEGLSPGDKQERAPGALPMPAFLAVRARKLPFGMRLKGAPPGYRGDWMRRPIAANEVGFLVRALVALSDRVNGSMALQQYGVRSDLRFLAEHAMLATVAAALLLSMLLPVLWAWGARLLLCALLVAASVQKQRLE